MNENEITSLLAELLTSETVAHVSTFADEGLLTGDSGLVVRVGGAEFQIAVTQSATAPLNGDL